MTAEIPKPAEIRKIRGYFWRRLLSKWPLLIWIGMCILTYQLYQRGVRFERMNGVVVAETEILSSLEDGRIRALHVNESGDGVDAGQVVIEMDDSMAIGELEQTKQEIAGDSIDMARKTSTLKSGLLKDISELKAAKAGDEAQREALEKSLVNKKAGRRDGVVPQSDVDALELEIATLDATLPSYDTRLSDLSVELAKVEELLTRIRTFGEEEPVILKSMQDRIDRMKLKSTNGGSVSRIFFPTGSVVRRGEPIVSIINMSSRTARGFIQEGDADKVSVGQQVWISPTGEATANIYPGKITYIAPEISSTPDIGSSVAGRMIKGREITCSFDNPKIELLPGQSVSIHLTKPGKFKLFDFGPKK